MAKEKRKNWEVGKGERKEKGGCCEEALELRSGDAREGAACRFGQIRSTSPVDWGRRLD